MTTICNIYKICKVQGKTSFDNLNTILLLFERCKLSNRLLKYFQSPFMTNIPLNYLKGQVSVKIP